MSEYELTALPPEHERVWRQAAPDVAWVLRELHAQRVVPSSILVVVALGSTLAGALLEEALDGWLVAGPCGAGPSTPVVAVLVGGAMREFVGEHDGAAHYMAELPADCCGLLVLADDGPVITACEMPTAGLPYVPLTHPSSHRRRTRSAIARGFHRRG